MYLSPCLPLSLCQLDCYLLLTLLCVSFVCHVPCVPCGSSFSCRCSHCFFCLHLIQFFYYYFYTSCVFATCLFWSCVWTLKPSEWSCLRKVHLLLCYLPSFVCCILPSLLQWDNWCTVKRYPVVIISLLTLTWYRYSYYIARNHICSRPLTCILCNLFLSHCHQNTISCFCFLNETCISPMYKEHKK